MSRNAWLALILTALLVLAVLAYGRRNPPTAPDEVGTRTYSQPLGATRALEVDLTMGTGMMDVRMIDSANAYEAEITRSAPVDVRVAYRDGKLRIRDRAGRFFRRRRNLNSWKVGLNRRVPIDLEASTGAGRAAFDLTGMTGSADIKAGAGEVLVAFHRAGGRIERLQLQGGVGRFEVLGLGYARADRIEARAGVGEFVLDFTGASTGTMTLDLRGGVGRIALRIPPGLGVRVQARRGLGRLRLSGFRQVSDDEYVNEEWDRASARLEVRASLGVGALEIEGR